MSSELTEFRTGLFVLKKTNNRQIVIADRIQKHVIVFEYLKEKSTVIVTSVSYLVEHD